MGDDELFDDDLFDDLEDLDDDYDGSASTDSLHQTGVSALASKHGLGGFENMSEQDMEDFKKSDEQTSE